MMIIKNLEVSQADVTIEMLIYCTQRASAMIFSAVCSEHGWSNGCAFIDCSTEKLD